MGWRHLVAGAAVLTVLLVATWHAGRESGQLDGQRLSAEMDLLTQEIASNQVALADQRKKTTQLEQALKSGGKTPNLVLVSQLHQQLLQAQAEANQYKTIIQRERQRSTDNQLLIEALSVPGARLLPLKISEAGGDCKAYALLAENGRLLLIASGLPKLPEGKQFQLWLLRTEEPKVVSAGVFSGDENRHALMTFDDPSALADVAKLEITEEPEGGSSEPNGTKILETTPSEKPE
jgi:anti-sigma-K factor RskA